MRRLPVVGIAALVLAGTAGAYTQLRTIFITPGHCVRVGDTRVCARAALRPPVKTAGKAQDEGFVVQSLRVRSDGLGNIAGTTRITNTNDRTLTITFTITFLKSNGSVVGRATGSANEVMAGSTVTVSLVSQDPISALPSPFRYRFRVDSEF
jgi:hypothetical protein